MEVITDDILKPKSFTLSFPSRVMKGFVTSIMTVDDKRIYVYETKSLRMRYNISAFELKFANFTLCDAEIDTIKRVYLLPYVLSINFQINDTLYEVEKSYYTDQFEMLNMLEILTNTLCTTMSVNCSGDIWNYDTLITYDTPKTHYEHDLSRIRGLHKSEIHHEHEMEQNYSYNISAILMNYKFT